MGRLHPKSHFLDIPLANGFAPPSSRHHFAAPPPLHLTSNSREDTTRVQLQKQRLHEQHHAIVVSQKIPGFKTSAGMSEVSSNKEKQDRMISSHETRKKFGSNSYSLEQPSSLHSVPISVSTPLLHQAHCPLLSL